MPAHALILCLVVLSLSAPHDVNAQGYSVDDTDYADCIGRHVTNDGTVLTNNCTFTVNVWVCMTGGDQWTENRCKTANTGIKGPWQNAPSFRLAYQQSTNGLGNIRSDVSGTPGDARVAACAADSDLYLAGAWSPGGTPVYECRRTTGTGGDSGSTNTDPVGQPTGSPELVFEGRVQWQHVNSSDVQFQAERVTFACPQGYSGTSGSIRISLWAVENPYSGGTITGDRLGTHRLSQVLNCNQSFSGLTATTDYTLPGYGSWYTVMSLDFYDGGQWASSDTVSFDGRLDVPAPEAHFSGRVGFQISGTSARLQAERVEYSCAFGDIQSDNELRMQLWSLDEPFLGGTVQGRVLARAELGSLRCNQYFSPVNRLIPLQNSVVEDEYLMMTLERRNSSGQWGWSEFLNFPKTEESSGENPTLTVYRTGSGTVTSQPAGIDCGNDCQGEFAEDSQVQLTAQPASGWRIERWGRGCGHATGSTCTIDIPTDRTASVFFERVSGGSDRHSLTVYPNGSGTVTSQPAGIDCGNDCQGEFAEDSQVQLTAQPASGWRIERWGRGCGHATGSTCTIDIPTDRTASVFFEPEFSSVQKVSAGGQHTCALSTSGHVKCWGSNTFGQLGNDGPSVQRRPAFVEGFNERIVDIAAGLFHTCAVSESDTMYCWGKNTSGQLGIGVEHPLSTTPRSLFVGGDEILDFGVGDAHTCALLKGAGNRNALRCWGRNGLGQLGNPGQESVSLSWMAANTAELIDGNVVKIAVGSLHTCAWSQQSSGSYQPFCWGNNDNGQLGLPNSYDDYVSEPRRVALIEAAYESVEDLVLEAGHSNTCAGTRGDFYCWGSNLFGQLGVGDTNPVAAPPNDSFFFAFTSVDIGQDHLCLKSRALAWDEGIFCSGNNSHGQIGVGTYGNLYPEVRQLPGGATMDDVTTGFNHSCGWSSQDVFCWGLHSSGQLGVWTSDELLLSPTRVENLID